MSRLPRCLAAEASAKDVSMSGSSSDWKERWHEQAVILPERTLTWAGHRLIGKEYRHEAVPLPHKRGQRGIG